MGWVPPVHHLERVIEIHKTLDVRGSPGTVYDYLTNPERIVEYVGPIKRIYRLSTPAVEAGTRLSVDVRFLGIAFTQRCECATHDPPKRFQARSVGGRFYFEAAFALNPSADGTRIECSGYASAPSLFGLAEAILGFLIERQIDGDLGRLKRRLDAAG
jgi:carbon monoxide dehydrogenase subunit G